MFKSNKLFKKYLLVVNDYSLTNTNYLDWFLKINKYFQSLMYILVYSLHKYTMQLIIILIKLT